MTHTVNGSKIANIFAYMLAYEKRLEAEMSPTSRLESRIHLVLNTAVIGADIDQVVLKTLKMFIQGDVFL